MLPPIRKSRSKQLHGSSQGWRTIGDKTHYFRSSWEVNYALYLQWLKKTNLIADWEYEPKEFWFEGIKRGCVTYKPDFRILRPTGEHYWVEVKGYMDAKSKTKLKRFKRYFPDEELFVIDKAWFAKNRNLPVFDRDWENIHTAGKNYV